MSDCAISIALASYNGACFLPQLLESLLAQTLQPKELVVTDDGSTDDSVAIIRAFAARAPFAVRVEHNPQRLGYRSNFMRAAGLCTGDYVAFCDQDDVWHPDKLAVMHAAFDQPSVLLAHHNARVVDENGAPLGVLWPDDPAPHQDKLQPWRFALGFTQIFSAEFLQFNDLWPLSRDQNKAGVPMGHDQWYFFLASTFGSVARCDATLVDYRQHLANTVGWVSGPSLWRKLRYRMERRAGIFELCRLDMRARAEVLQQIAGRPGHRWSSQASDFAARYAELAELYEFRRDLYTAASSQQRWQAFRAVQTRHGYDYDGNWTFSKRARVRDIVKGVLLGPVIERIGFVPAGGDPECYGTQPQADRLS